MILTSFHVTCYLCYFHMICLPQFQMLNAWFTDCDANLGGGVTGQKGYGDVSLEAGIFLGSLRLLPLASCLL
jgi:hypothetical protein